jgi:uncharacterized membrane protein
MPLIYFTVIIGAATAIMIHFLHMAIMWLRNWPSTRTVTSEHFLNRIFGGIIGALLGLFFFMVCKPTGQAHGGRIKVKMVSFNEDFKNNL